VTAEEFFAAAWAAGELARERQGGPIARFQLGDGQLEIRSASSVMAQRMARAWDHLRRPAAGDPVLTISVFDSAESGVTMPPPAWGRDDYLTRNRVRGYETGRFRALYNIGLETLHLIDLETRRAIYWIKNGADTPWWEQTFPFRQILHWWTGLGPWQLVHAGAVGYPDGGILIAGRSGAGKSTTTLSCLRGALAYAGDDYALAGLGGDTPWFYSLFGTAKVESANLHRVEHLRGWISNEKFLADQKAMMYVNEHAPERILPAAPIRAIVLPRVIGSGPTDLHPATAKDVAEAIAPTVLMHMTGFERETMTRIAALGRRVPSFWLRLGENPAGTAPVLEELLSPWKP